MVSGTVSTTLSGLLSGLSGGQLLNLGGHLTTSAEAQAIAIIEEMRAAPSGAQALVASLATIADLPPQVLVYINNAISALPNQETFDQNIVNAEEVLQASLTSESALDKLGL